MNYTRFAEMTVELRRREDARRQRRGPLIRTIFELRAQLLQHLDAHDVVRQPIPGGHLIKRMVSTTYRSVTNEALNQALRHALNQALHTDDAALVRVFKTELLKQLKVSHVYADIVTPGGRQDKTACYVGECGTDEMKILSELDPDHPMHATARSLRAALEDVADKVDDDSIKSLQTEHRELGVVVTQELRAEGTQVLRIGDRRGSLKFRRVQKKPKLSASLCSTQLAAALSNLRSQYPGVLDLDVVVKSLMGAIDDHIRTHTVVVESAGLKMHRT